MELCIAGDVRHVLSGIAQKQAKKIPLTELAFGLGAGKYEEDDFGETIVINGNAYVHTVSGVKQFQNTLETPFLMGFSEHPSSEIIHESSISLDMLYRRLFEKYPQGVLVYGEVGFESLHAAFLKKSPIFGENCNEKKEAYWQLYNDSAVQGIVVGVIAREAYPEGFYVNPNEKSDLLSHSHVLIDGTAYHLFTQSLVANGTFFISPIDSVKIIS